MQRCMPEDEEGLRVNLYYRIIVAVIQGGEASKYTGFVSFLNYRISSKRHQAVFRLLLAKYQH